MHPSWIAYTIFHTWKTACSKNGFRLLLTSAANGPQMEQSIALKINCANKFGWEITNYIPHVKSLKIELMYSTFFLLCLDDGWYRMEPWATMVHLWNIGYKSNISFSQKKLLKFMLLSSSIHIWAFRLILWIQRGKWIRCMNAECVSFIGCLESDGC